MSKQLVLPAKLEIEITLDDIKCGKRCRTKLCPEALAVNRALGIGPEVCERFHSDVVHRDVVIYDLEKNVRVATYINPPALVDWISKFDVFDAVDPITATLVKR